MGVAMMRVTMMIGLVASVVSVAYAATGTATYYTAPYIPSYCFGYQDQGVMIAAASDAIWNNGAACGRNYRVTGTGPCRGSVVVKIVDYCPPLCAGTIVLSQEAFSAICHDLNAGKVPITYDQV